MARRQSELPGTRRDDEPKPPPQIKALDEALEAWERAKARRTTAAQRCVETKRAAQALLHEHGLKEYPYLDLSEIERKFFAEETVKSCKVKKEKRRPVDEGEDE